MRDDGAELPRFASRTDRIMPPITFSPARVFKQLSGLDLRKAGGPDRLASRVLKDFAAELTPCITAPFGETLARSGLPEVWKHSYVSPLHKSGARSDPGNYRPISLTCVLCKLFEHILVSSIMNHLDEQRLLSDHQHGFRRKRSCEGQLISVLHQMTMVAERGGAVDAVFLDLRKAFDCVEHR